MTADQQKRLDEALGAYNKALNAEQTALNNYNNLANAALACQKARDQYSFGPKKNDACHIDTLTSLKSQRDVAQQVYLKAVAYSASNKAAYEKVKAEIYSASQQAIATNPDLVLNQQNVTNQQTLNAQTLAAQQAIEAKRIAAEAADNEAKRKSQQKTIFYVGGGILAVAVIIFLIYRFTR